MSIFKQCLPTIFCLAITVTGKTQASDYGAFTQEEKLLKQVSFDKEADAVILFDVANASYNEAYNLIIERRIRIKILKEKGINNANIEIPFYTQNGFETITGIRGVTYSVNSTGTSIETELASKDIFKQKINDNFSVVKFALPNVKVGSILEYSYQDIYKNFGGLDNWYFQAELPTLYSKFFFAVPPRAEFAYSVHKSETLPININNDKKQGFLTFEMGDIPGLRNEPFMDAAKDYLQHVDFQLSGLISNSGAKINYLNKWSDVSGELMGESYFGKQIDKSLGNSQAIIAKFTSIPGMEQRMKAVHNYVKEKFSWNGYNTKYTDEGIKDLWEKGKGSSAEINLLLIKLLRNAGVDAYPLLVSERSHGKVNTSYPILQEFNKTMAYVVVNDNPFVLDGTDDKTPYNMLPENVLNTTAFLVDKKKGRILTLKDSIRSKSNIINLYSHILLDGNIRGEASVTSSDYGRINRTKAFKNDKEKFTKEYFTNSTAGLTVHSLVVANLESDSLPLMQEFKYTLPVSTTGDYKMINLNLFTGLEKNPFISDNRFSDINFGSRQNTVLIQQFEIPANYKLEAIPKNILLRMPDKSIIMSRMASLNNNILSVELSVKIERAVFAAYEYPMIQEFYKKMYSYLDEPLVLSTK